MKIGQLGLPLPNGHKIVADAYKNGGARMISHDIDITELVENALDGGLLKCMSSEFYSKFHQDQLSYFCNKYGFYANDVKKIDYKKAILKYKPQVVVASWVTHNDLNIYGMDEQWILDNCETYIHFGHTEVHSAKRINDIEHVSLKLEPLNWMFSRSFRKSPILQIWGNN